jgi:hypothetical protein
VVVTFAATVPDVPFLVVYPSQKEFVCPYCGTKGKGSTNAKRWHFDNCKQKGNS